MVSVGPVLRFLCTSNECAPIGPPVWKSLRQYVELDYSAVFPAGRHTFAAL